MKKQITLLFLAISLIANAQCNWPKVYNSAKYLQFHFDKQGEVIGQFSHDNFSSMYNHTGLPMTSTVTNNYNESCVKYSNTGAANWVFNENFGFATIIPFDNGSFFLGSLTNRILNSNGTLTGLSFPTTGYSYYEGFSNQLLQFNGTTLNALDVTTGALVTTSSLPALSNFVISTTYVKGTDLYLVGHYYSTMNYDNNVVIKLNQTMTTAVVKTTALNISKIAISNSGVMYMSLYNEVGVFNWATSVYTLTEATGYSVLLKYDNANTRMVYFNATNSIVKFIYDNGTTLNFPITITGTAPTFDTEVDYFNDELLISASNSIDGAAGGSINGSAFPYLTTSFYENVILHRVSLSPIKASFSVPHSNVCLGSLVTYSSTSTGNPTSFNWSFPGGSPSSSTLQNPTVIYCNAGLYSASLTVANCTSSATAAYTNYVSVSYTNCIEPACGSTLAESFGGPSSDMALAVRTDAAGNIYTTGRFLGTVDFDPGAGISNLTATTSNYETYITKFDASGNFIWVKQLAAQVGSTSAWNKADELVIDTQGDIYLSGTYAQTVDFDPGSGVSNLTSGPSAESFILKLNSCGEFVWVRRYGADGFATRTNITIDNANNIYIAGLFSTTINIGPFILATAGNWDGYVASINSAGTFLWAKRIGSSGVDYINDITVNSAGNPVLTGLFSNTVDFDPNATIFNLVSAGGYDAFVLTLTSAGNFVWAKRIGNTGDDVGRELVINSVNDIIILGDYTGVVDFDPNAGVSNITSVGGKDVFVLKLNNLGNYLWSGSIGNVLDNYSRKMSIDGLNNVYVSGDYSSTMDIDPSTAVFNITTPGVTYISKINSGNAFVWGRKINSAYIDGMTCDAHNDLIIAGQFSGTSDFDINAGVINLTSNGNTDAFVAKYCSGSLLRVAQIEEANELSELESSIGNEVNIYPNPTISNVFITVPAEWGLAKIVVYNTVGQIVMTSEMDKETQTELALESLKDGLYFINVSNNEHSITKKLVKNTNK